MATIAEQLIGSALEFSKKGPDALGALKTGAELATAANNIKQSREKLEQAKADNITQKWTVVGSMYDRWQKLPDGEAKKNIGTKVIPALLTNFGLAQDMNPAVAEILAKDPLAGAFINSKVRDGSINLPDMIAATKDVDTFTKFLVDNEMEKFGSAELLKSTIGESLPVLQKSYEEKLSSSESDNRAEIAARGRAEQLGNRQDFEIEKRFTDFVVRTSDKTRATFKDINAMQSGIRTANDLLSGLEAKLRKGETLSSSERAKLGVAMEPIVRGIGQAKGPLSDDDLSRIVGRYGISGKFDEITEKFITGKPSMEQIKAFKDIIEAGAKNIDADIQAKARQLQGTWSLPEFRGKEGEIERAVRLNEYTRPTLPKKAKSKDAINIGGKQYSKSALKKLIDKNQNLLDKLAEESQMTVQEVQKLLGD